MYLTQLTNLLRRRNSLEHAVSSYGVYNDDQVYRITCVYKQAKDGTRV